MARDKDRLKKKKREEAGARPGREGGGGEDRHTHRERMSQSVMCVWASQFFYYFKIRLSSIDIYIKRQMKKPHDLQQQLCRLTIIIIILIIIPPPPAHRVLSSQ